MIELRRRYSGGSNSLLPKGYQLVEYLYCDKVAYAHTGCATNIPFDNEGYYEVLVSVPTVPDAYGGYYKIAFGSISTTGGVLNGCGYQGYAKNLLIWGTYGQSNAGSFDMENIGIVKMKLTCKPFKLFVYDEGENNLLHSYSYWSTAHPNEGPIFLMGGGVASSTAWFGKYYGAKAFNSNGEMYAYFHPCRRKSDNMVGFYESVTEQFFEMLPAGTTLGVFAGPDIIE